MADLSSPPPTGDMLLTFLCSVDQLVLKYHGDDNKNHTQKLTQLSSIILFVLI